MAMGIMFTCKQCGFGVMAWDEGNPYIEFPKGQRHYFYHPGGEHKVLEVAKEILGHSPNASELDRIRKKYVSNASDYICRECGEQSMIDPQKDPLVCNHCGGKNVEDLFSLASAKCIKCSGYFSEGEMGAIS